LLAVQILSAILLGIVFANLEIQIEGKSGWAADLPCWRKEKGWVVRLLGGRPLTGYHMWMSIFLILMFHFPFLFTGWYLKTELLLWGLLYGFFLVEDFAWFVFNPHYGIRKFKKAEIWWHGSWWGPVPSIYYFLAGMAIILIVLSQVVFP
jgi:hypothetical protein